MMDTHVFAQKPSREDVDNSPMLLYHMQKHGIDMCILKATVGMSNAFNADLVEKHPDKFIAVCNDEQTQIKSQSGEAPLDDQSRREGNRQLACHRPF